MSLHCCCRQYCMVLWINEWLLTTCIDVILIDSAWHCRENLCSCPHRWYFVRMPEFGFEIDAAHTCTLSEWSASIRLLTQPVSRADALSLSQRDASLSFHVEPLVLECLLCRHSCCILNIQEFLTEWCGLMASSGIICLEHHGYL